MAYNGAGVFNRLYNWVQDKANGIKVRADRMDAEMDGFATGLSTCITKDGQTTITADIPFANNKITGLGAATALTDAATFGQVQSQASNGATVGGTADAITLTVSPAITAYAALQRFRFVATGTNTGAVTVAVSGLATKAIQANGVALVAGDIVTGRTYEIMYDGTAFQLFSSKAAVLHTADIADAAIASVKLGTDAKTGAVRAVTGTTDTILSTDRGKLVTYSNASPIAVTIPQATGDFTTPFKFSYVNLGAGTVTFTPTTSTIDGAATLEAETGDGGEIFSDATNYFSQRGSQIDVLPIVSTRQTVQSGPVTSDGLPNFGGSTGSGTVTMSGTLIATAANGFSATGQVDRVASITNASFTGLTTDGTMYLYLDLAADGTATAGSGTLAPIYQFGGTPSTTSGQFTFNISQMTAYVGNGSAAPATYRVYVGQVTVASNVVTAITWYALNGRYVAPWTATLPGASTAVSFDHNIGTTEIYGPRDAEIECSSASQGYAVGDRIGGSGMSTFGNGYSPHAITLTGPNTCQFATGGTNSWYGPPKAGGTTAGLTVGNFRYRVRLQRGW